MLETMTIETALAAESPAGTRLPERTAASEREQLASRAINGDEEALAELLESVTRTALYYTSSTLRNRMDAEDAVQEVLMRVFTRIGTLKNPRKIDAWLRTLIINETRRYILKHYTYNDLDISDYENIEEARGEAIPHLIAEDNERSDAILRSVGKLTERQKEAVYSVHYLGASIKDTAKAMGIKSPSVIDNLKLAYKKIERDLREEGLAPAAGMGVLPLAASINSSLLRDAETFTIKNAKWVAQTAGKYGSLAHHAAASAASAGFAMKAVVTPLICVTAAAAVVTGTVVINNKMQSAVLEADPIVSAQYIVAADGGIIFAGRADNEQINPFEATVWVTVDVSVIGWRITPGGSGEALYSGDGASADEALAQLLESGMDGRYVLEFRMQDAAGGYYTVDREFWIDSSK